MSFAGRFPEFSTTMFSAMPSPPPAALAIQAVRMGRFVFLHSSQVSVIELKATISDAAATTIPKNAHGLAIALVIRIAELFGRPVTT